MMRRAGDEHKDQNKQSAKGKNKTNYERWQEA